MVAGSLVVLALVAGAAVWFVFFRGNDMAEHAAALWDSDPESSAEYCAFLLTEASNEDEFVDLFVDNLEGGRTELVESIRESAGDDGLPEEAANWGWKEVEQILRALYHECESHPEEVAAASRGFEDEPMVQSCEIERVSIITAWAAARTANEVNAPDQQETWSDYFFDEDLEWFEEPTEAGADRINAAEVPEDECEPIAADELR